VEISVSNGGKELLESAFLVPFDQRALTWKSLLVCGTARTQSLLQYEQKDPKRLVSLPQPRLSHRKFARKVQNTPSQLGMNSDSHMACFPEQLETLCFKSA
jgi:hypothetical protein